MLLKDKKLDHLKNGPVYWMNSADSHTCLATASAAMWTLRCDGRLFHSGLPHKVYVSNNYNTGRSTLPDIYALALGRALTRYTH